MVFSLSSSSSLCGLPCVWRYIQPGTGIWKRKGGIFQARFIMRLKCHFLPFLSQRHRAHRRAAAGRMQPAMRSLGSQESLSQENDTKFINWKPSESFNTLLVSSLSWRKQMSISQQLKRGKQLHNGSNLSEITRSQSTIIITLVSTKPSGRNPRYKHKWSNAQRF